MILTRFKWKLFNALRSKSKGRLSAREMGDECILGSGKFVQQLLEEAGGKIMHQMSNTDLVKRAEEETLNLCQRENIEVAALRSGSRRRAVSPVRSHLALKLAEKMGLSLAETARQLGLSTSAVAQILRRRQ